MKTMLRLFLLVGSCATLVFGQADRGTLVGTVTDATGAIVPGAKVTITQTATNVATNQSSLDSGDYSGINLPVGVYSVRVEKEGFKPSVRSGVTVSAASTVRVDFKLEVGTAQQTVVVTSDVNN